jgi:hypothetical protein
MNEWIGGLRLSKKFVERHSSVALFGKMSDSENRSTATTSFWAAPLLEMDCDALSVRVKLVLDFPTLKLREFDFAHFKSLTSRRRKQ